MDSQGREDCGKVGAGGPSKVAAGRPSEVQDCGTGQARLQLADPVAPHSCIDKLGGMRGNKTGCATQGSSTGK